MYYILSQCIIVSQCITFKILNKILIFLLIAKSPQKCATESDCLGDQSWYWIGTEGQRTIMTSDHLKAVDNMMSNEPVPSKCMRLDFPTNTTVTHQLEQAWATSGPRTTCGPKHLNAVCDHF